MFKNLFAGLFGNPTHVHTVPVIDEETGEIGSRVVSCADVQAGVHLHTRSVTVPDGKGGYTTKLVQISCLEAETERQNLLREVASNERTIAVHEGTIASLKADVANYQRLIQGALQMIFHMGPALQKLLSDDLAAPALTADQTAVLLEGVTYSVVLDPFGEMIVVRDVTGTVPERRFNVIDGRLSTDQQTLLYGHVGRIKAAVASGVDPVAGEISLVDASVASTR